MSDQQKCSKCRKLKPLEEFTRSDNRNKSLRVMKTCNECSNKTKNITKRDHVSLEDRYENLKQMYVRLNKMYLDKISIKEPEISHFSNNEIIDILSNMDQSKNTIKLYVNTTKRIIKDIDNKPILDYLKKLENVDSLKNKYINNNNNNFKGLNYIKNNYKLDKIISDNITYLFKGEVGKCDRMTHFKKLGNDVYHFETLENKIEKEFGVDSIQNIFIRFFSQMWW